MRTAQRALTVQPAIVLWAELAAAAHLSGWGAPVPDPAVLDVLRAMPVRLRDCTLSHAVDAAVASRSAVIAPTCAPDRLGAHLTAVLRGRLDGESVCDGDEIEYFAEPYRWCLVLEELQRSHRQTPDGGRHPRSGEWERDYGRAIPGDTLAQQLQRVSAWWDRGQRDQDACRAVLWGAAVPSAIETAAGARRDDDDWSQRLREAVAELSNADGLIRFYSPAGRASEQSES
jgi:hypothetical protein